MSRLLWFVHSGPSWTRLLAILCLAVTLRLFLFVGYANVDPWDDTVYLEMASRFRHGQFEATLRQVALQLRSDTVPRTSAFAVRPGTYVPIALFQLIFGANERASALPSLLASIGTLLLIYRIGLRLSGHRPALLGSLFFAIVPLDLVYATRILADVPMTFWITASVAATVEATRGRHDRPARWLLMALGGLCLFLAYITRASAILGLPIVGVALLTAPERKRAATESLVAWAVLTLSLVLYNQQIMKLSGHFWLAFEVERASNRAMFTSLSQAVLHPYRGLAVHCSYVEGVPHHFFKLFLGTVQHYGGLKLFSSFAPLGAVALLHALLRRHQGFLVFWTVFVFAYYQYGFRELQWNASERVLDYYLVAQHPRYLHLLLPPLCLLLGVLITAATSRNRLAAAFLVASLLGPSIYRTRQNYTFYRGSLEDLRDASRFLCARQPAPIYTDRWAVGPLRFFSGGKLKDIRLPWSETPLEPGSWAVFGGSRGYELDSQEVASTLPPPYGGYHLNPSTAPASWKVAHQRIGLRNVARQSDLFIWKIPPRSP